MPPAGVTSGCFRLMPESMIATSASKRRVVLWFPSPIEGAGGADALEPDGDALPGQVLAYRAAGDLLAPARRELHVIGQVHVGRHLDRGVRVGRQGVRGLLVHHRVVGLDREHLPVVLEDGALRRCHRGAEDRADGGVDVGGRDAEAARAVAHVASQRAGTGRAGVPVAQRHDDRGRGRVAEDPGHRGLARRRSTGSIPSARTAAMMARWTCAWAPSTRATLVATTDRAVAASQGSAVVTRARSSASLVPRAPFLT